jgi:hypothetical protein
MTDQELVDWKICKKSIVKDLVKFRIIPQGFTGDLKLHISQGGIGDIDLHEDGILRRMEKRSE